MKKFLLFIVTPCLLTCFIIHACIVGLVTGKTDPFYLRTTKTNSTNFILGTSRAAQGIQPSVMNKITNIEFYNFAFTIAHSPFGKVYNQAIFNKIDTNVRNQVFIIAVDPWSISSKCKDPNSEVDFRENEGFLANITEFNKTPNISYCLRYIKPKDVVKSYLNQNPKAVLREDGWLEINVDMDSAQVKKRLKSKISMYRDKNLPRYKYSPLRKESLFFLAERLSQYGKVFLVRLPVHPEMMAIEYEMMPFFKDSIEDVIAANAGYLDLTIENADYSYTDGNHLHKISGEVVSEKIALWIKAQL